MRLMRIGPVGAERPVLSTATRPRSIFMKGSILDRRDVMDWIDRQRQDLGAA